MRAHIHAQESVEISPLYTQFVLYWFQYKTWFVRLEMWAKKKTSIAELLTSSCFVCVLFWGQNIYTTCRLFSFWFFWGRISHQNMYKIGMGGSVPNNNKKENYTYRYVYKHIHPCIITTNLRRSYLKEIDNILFFFLQVLLDVIIQSQ